MRGKHPLHPLDRGEEVRQLAAAQVCQALMWLVGTDEDVAGQEGLEVHEREGVGCC